MPFIAHIRFIDHDPHKQNKPPKKLTHNVQLASSFDEDHPPRIARPKLTLVLIINLRQRSPLTGILYRPIVTHHIGDAFLRPDMEDRGYRPKSESEDGDGGGEGVAEEEHLEGWFVEGDVCFWVEAVDEGVRIACEEDS